MKTSGWIKFIGILCIIFGITGLINSISLIGIVNMDKVIISEFSPNAQQLIKILGYVGVLVYTFYLTAGIFFLVKKPFSLKFINIALVISILFIILPLLIINEGHPYMNFRFGLSNLLSPALDIGLLIGVGIISKNYFNKPGELKESKILPPGRLKVLTFLGLVCLFIPLSIFGLWILAVNLGDNHIDSVAIYNSYFPVFLHGRYDISYLSLAFCLLAIILSSISLKLSGKIWKTLNMLILVFSILLLLLNLWGLM